MKSGKTYSRFYTDFPTFSLHFSRVFKPFSTPFFEGIEIINKVLINSTFLSATFSFLLKKMDETPVNNIGDKNRSKSNKIITKLSLKILSTVSTAYHQHHRIIILRKREKKYV